MQSPLLLTFVELERSAAIVVALRELGERLLRHSARITRCHITAEGVPGSPSIPHRVRVHLSLPSAEIHAGETCREGGGAGAALQEVLTAVYADARRQLQALERQRFSKLDGGLPPPG